MKVNREITYSKDKNGCHNRTSHKIGREGYARTMRKGKTYTIPRLVFVIRNGDPGPDVVIRHTCDNRACINLYHLIPGTIQDNVNDRHSRGRTSRKPRTNGETNGRSKLTKKQVISIIKSNKSQRELSEKYAVHQTRISAIKNRSSWKHLEV